MHRIQLEGVSTGQIWDYMSIKEVTIININTGIHWNS
jgi:hypothetical protein